jgi:hypothetical protein
MHNQNAAVPWLAQVGVKVLNERIHVLGAVLVTPMVTRQGVNNDQ